MCWRAMPPAAGPWLLPENVLLPENGLLLQNGLLRQGSLLPQGGLKSAPLQGASMGPYWRQQPSAMARPAGWPVAAAAPEGRHRWP